MECLDLHNNKQQVPLLGLVRSVIGSSQGVRGRGVWPKPPPPCARGSGQVQPKEFRCQANFFERKEFGVVIPILSPPPFWVEGAPPSWNGIFKKKSVRLGLPSMRWDGTDGHHGSAKPVGAADQRTAEGPHPRATSPPPQPDALASRKILIRRWMNRLSSRY